MSKFFKEFILALFSFGLVISQNSLSAVKTQSEGTHKSKKTANTEGKIFYDKSSELINALKREKIRKSGRKYSPVLSTVTCQGSSDSFCKPTVVTSDYSSLNSRVDKNSQRDDSAFQSFLNEEQKYPFNKGLVEFIHEDINKNHIPNNSKNANKLANVQDLSNKIKRRTIESPSYDLYVYDYDNISKLDVNKDCHKRALAMMCAIMNDKKNNIKLDPNEYYSALVKNYGSASVVIGVFSSKKLNPTKVKMLWCSENSGMNKSELLNFAKERLNRISPKTRDKQSSKKVQGMPLSKVMALAEKMQADVDKKKLVFSNKGKITKDNDKEKNKEYKRSVLKDTVKISKKSHAKINNKKLNKTNLNNKVKRITNEPTSEQYNKPTYSFYFYSNCNAEMRLINDNEDNKQNSAIAQTLMKKFGKKLDVYDVIVVVLKKQHNIDTPVAVVGIHSDRCHVLWYQDNEISMREMIEAFRATGKSKGKSKIMKIFEESLDKLVGYFKKNESKEMYTIQEEDEKINRD